MNTQKRKDLLLERRSHMIDTMARHSQKGDKKSAGISKQAISQSENEYKKLAMSKKM